MIFQWFSLWPCHEPCIVRGFRNKPNIHTRQWAWTSTLTVIGALKTRWRVDRKVTFLRVFLLTPGIAVHGNIWTMYKYQYISIYFHIFPYISMVMYEPFKLSWLPWTMTSSWSPRGWVVVREPSSGLHLLSHRDGLTQMRYVYVCIWGFPEIGIPLNHPF